MSNQDDTNEGSDWFERFRNRPPCTEEEQLAARRKRAEEIRQDGLPQTVTIDSKTFVLEPVHVQPPQTELPDEATMARMIDDALKEGCLPYWTHWTPAVRHFKNPKNMPPSPKPIIFDGTFLGYEFENGGFILV